MTPELFEEFRDVWEMERAYTLHHFGHQLRALELERSNSGLLHLRVHITPPAKDDYTLNLLQFLMGDHAWRVEQNQKRIKAGILHWNKLFVRKAALKK